MKNVAEAAIEFIWCKGLKGDSLDSEGRMREEDITDSESVANFRLLLTFRFLRMPRDNFFTFLPDSFLLYYELSIYV